MKLGYPGPVIRRLLPVLLALGLALPSARPARACAPAYPPDAQVRIADEAAIIVWDEEARKQHFIRRATFTSTVRDFGFLVPSPSVPELAEVKDDAFWALERRVAPAVVHQKELKGVVPTLLCAMPFFLGLKKEEAAPEAAVASAPVRVLHAQKVAGYNAVVLEADRADALAEWLRMHGYSSRPALAAWLEPYIAGKWKITAFKIAPEQQADHIETAAVRMSFTTDRPFFPYREPSDQREEPAPGAPRPVGVTPAERLLRVFLISRSRMEGALGDGKRAWPGEVKWANHLVPEGLPSLSGLEGVPIPFQNAWLTSFEDHASPRPGIDEVYFAPARDRSPVVPPPIVVPDPVRIPIPLDLLALVVGLSWWGVRRVRRSRDEGSAAPS